MVDSSHADRALSPPPKHAGILRFRQAATTVKDLVGRSSTAGFHIAQQGSSFADVATGMLAYRRFHSNVDQQGGLMTTAITIETIEQLHDHIHEKKDELEKSHLDEVEQLNQVFTDELKSFKNLCQEELAGFNPNDPRTQQLLDRTLMVQKMRMQRLKEHQLGAKHEVDKRHAKENKKMESVIAKRLGQYNQAHKSDVAKKEKALTKLLAFLNGPTFSKMLEDYPIEYIPLHFSMQKDHGQNKDDHDSDSEAQHLYSSNGRASSSKMVEDNNEKDTSSNRDVVIKNRMLRFSDVEGSHDEQEDAVPSNGEQNREPYAFSLGKEGKGSFSFDSSGGGMENTISTPKNSDNNVSVVKIPWFSDAAVSRFEAYSDLNDDEERLRTTVTLCHTKFEIVPPPSGAS